MTYSTKTRNNILIIMSVMIFGLSYGLSAPLISIALMAAGYDEIYIGINAALHAAGVLIAAPIVPKLYHRFLPKHLLAVSLLGIAILLIILPNVPLAIWFIFRLGLGFFSEIILVVSETWVNQNAKENARAKTMAFYITSLSIGFALGPLILSIIGHQMLEAFLVGSLITAMAFVAILFIVPIKLAQEQADPRSMFDYYPLIIGAIAAAFLNAALEAMGMSVLVIYAMNLGWSEQHASILLFVLLLGAIVMQIPIGWVADKMDRRHLVIILAICSTVGALLWPLVLSNNIISYLLLFVWGGVFVGIYTVVITIVGSRFQGTELATVYSILSISWAIGALIGPILAGVAMSMYLHGLPIVCAVLCFIFTIIAWLRKKEY